MVIGNVPVLVPVVVETVSVDVAVGPGVTGVEIEQVAPDGQPAMARSTLLLNPFNVVTVAVDVPESPCVSVSEAGLEEIVKSGAEDAFV